MARLIEAFALLGIALAIIFAVRLFAVWFAIRMSCRAMHPVDVENFHSADLIEEAKPSHGAR